MMTPRADPLRASWEARTTRLRMAALGLTLTLTAGFARVPQDDATVSMTVSGQSDPTTVIPPGQADTAGSSAVSALFAPIVNALTTRRAKSRSRSALAARRDAASSQLTYTWDLVPPAPMLPSAP